MTDVRAILVTGFGNTGSTSVMDLLRECEGYACPNQEFFLIQHPDGIMSLEDALVHSWSEFGPDWAIRRFRKLIDVLSRPSNWFQFGLNYPEHFGRDFKELSERYIENLAGMRYDGHLMFRRADMNKVEYFLYTLSGHPKFKKLKPLRECFTQKYDTAFVPDHAAFLKHTREYLGGILGSMTRGTNAHSVALLLGTSPYQITRTTAYFEKALTVIVDRDPRDVYLSARAGTYMPSDLDKFIQWFDRTRANAPVTETSVKVFFEDLVTKSETEVPKLCEFLGVKPSEHTKKGTAFDPKSSAKRIGKWKSYPAQDEIRRIEKELAPYLWKFKGNAPQPPKQETAATKTHISSTLN